MHYSNVRPIQLGDVQAQMPTPVGVFSVKATGRSEQVVADALAFAVAAVGFALAIAILNEVSKG